MDDQNAPGRCAWIALGFVVLISQELLPLSYVLGMAGINAADLIDHGGISELLRRIFVLGGMSAGLLIPAMIVMLLSAGMRKLLWAVRSEGSRSDYSMRNGPGR